MKYKASGMFQCDVEAESDVEAEWEALMKIKEEIWKVYIMDIEREE